MSVTGGFGNVQGLNFVNTMNNAGLVTGSNQAANIIGGLKSKISGIAPFAPLAAGAALFGKISSDAYQFSKDYHKAMLEVKTISKAAQADMRGVMDEILELSTKTPQNAIELAQGYYQIVSAGYDGAEALEILANSADLATSALTSTYTAADVITSILNAYGDKAGDVTFISDRLFEVVENGKTKLDEIAGSIVNVTGLAAQAGLELNDLFAAYSVGTKTLKTERFTTGMRGFLTTIIKPTQEAKEFAEMLGLEFNTTALRTKGLIGFMQDLQKATEGNTEALAMLFPNVEGLSGLLAMYADHGKEIVEQSKNIENAAGNVKRSMATMMEDVDNKWLVVQNKWNKSLSNLGDNLKAASSGLADFTSAMLQGQGAINPDMFDYVGGMLNQVELLRTIGYSKVDAYAKAALMTKAYVSDLLSNIYSDASEGKANVQNQLEKILGIEDAKKRLKELEQLLTSMKSGKAFEIKMFDDTDPVIKQSKAITRANIYSDLIKAINKEIDAAKKLAEVETEVDENSNQQSRAAFSERQVELLTLLAEKQKELNNLTAESAGYDKDSPELIESTNKRLDLVKEIAGIESELSKDNKIKPIRAKLTTKEIKVQLETNKELTNEQRKQLELQLSIIEAQQKRQKFNEDLSEGLKQSSELLGAIGYAAGQVDSDLGNALNKMADLAWNASNLAANLSNPLTAITYGIAMMGDIFSLFSKQDSGADKLQQSLDNINKTLEIQGQLLANANDENWFLIQAKQASDYNEVLKETQSNLQSMHILTKEEYDAYYQRFKQMQEDFPNFYGKMKWEDYRKNLTGETQNWEIDQFLQAWVGGEIYLSDEAQSYLNQALEAQARLEALINEGYRNRLGFDSDDVASTLRDGIIDGLNSTQGALYDWGNSFKEMLNQAIIQSMVTTWLNPEIDKYMEKLMEYSDIEPDGSIFSDSEKEDLKNRYQMLYEGGMEKMKELGFILESGSQNISAMEGTRVGATEESVSLLFGQITALRVDTKEMSVTVDEQLSVLTEALVYQEEIAKNTRYNKNLESINTKLDMLSSIDSKLT